MVASLSSIFKNFPFFKIKNKIEVTIRQVCEGVTSRTFPFFLDALPILVQPGLKKKNEETK